MASLYEILNELLSDKDAKKCSEETWQSISSKIENEAKKNIGNEEYKKFEDCLTKNKDKGTLKSLAEFARLTATLGYITELTTEYIAKKYGDENRELDEQEIKKLSEELTPQIILKLDSEKPYEEKEVMLGSAIIIGLHEYLKSSDYNPDLALEKELTLSQNTTDQPPPTAN
ncbi:MAG: hypothetical protein Q8N77_00535 [Nanoarchaeota archaeon]|nr:hypothetical protein [Nanoarchaeota archaeon]